MLIVFISVTTVLLWNFVRSNLTNHRKSRLSDVHSTQHAVTTEGMEGGAVTLVLMVEGGLGRPAPWAPSGSNCPSEVLGDFLAGGLTCQLDRPGQLN